MNKFAITPSVHYIGVDDRRTELFESLWSLPHGVTYNAYVVRGEKTALIDTVEEGYLEEYLEHLAATGAGSPDYLIVNHMEPDHSGSLPAVAERFPSLRIVGNAVTLGQIKGFYPTIDPSRLIAVKDGETLDLGGGKVLSFHTIPMVHWPETMVTCLVDEGILFTGDALGTFGALDGKVIDSETDGLELYFDEMYRYYACIVAKYAKPVQQALAKLARLDVRAACPTHGPVWTSGCGLARVLRQYDDMSAGRSERGAVVAFGSMYGHTAQMAKTVADTLAVAGMPVKLYDMSRADMSKVLADIWRYDTLVVGSATYNASVMPPVGALLSALEMRQLTGRRVAAFGNYTWAPMAARTIAKSFDSLGLEAACPAVEVKMSPTPADFDALRNLARSL